MTTRPTTTATQPTRLSPGRVRCVTAYIEAHLAERLTLAQLAAVARQSSSHLSHTWTATTGRAPLATVRHLRMERAAALLTETALPLGRIAQEVGCCSPAHFGRRFRAYAGMTPGQYRQAHALPRAAWR